MNIQLQFSPDQLTQLISSMASWGSTVPYQPQNLKKLAQWRMILGQMSLEDRAKLATHEPLFQRALWFVPEISNGKRSLDWDRLVDEKQPNYAELVREEALWMEAGLLRQRTWSSSEWPAVALIEACVRTQTSLPHLDSSLWQAVDRRAPGILKAILPLASGLDWEQFLQVPLKNYVPPINRASRIVSGDVPEIADLLMPFVPEGTVAKIDADRGGIFHAHFLPPDQVSTWVERGARANTQDSRGRFAEESWAYRPAKEVLAYHRALAPHRTVDDNAEALTRTCWELLVRQPLDDLEPLGVVEQLWTEPSNSVGKPADHLLSLVVQDRQNIAADVLGKNWRKVCQEVDAGTDAGAKWTMCLGGTNAVHGLALGFAMVMQDDIRCFQFLKSMRVANGEEALLVCLEHTADKALFRDHALNAAHAETWLPQPIQQLDRWEPVVLTLQEAMVEWMAWDVRNRSEALEDSEAPLGWMKVANAVLSGKPELARHPTWSPLLLASGLINALLKQSRYSEKPSLPALESMVENLAHLPEAQAWLGACPPTAEKWLNKYVPGLSQFVRAKALDERLPEAVPSAPKMRF